MIRGETGSRGAGRKTQQCVCAKGEGRRRREVTAPGLLLGKSGTTLGSQTYTFTQADTDQSVFVTTDTRLG